jgi:dUTP pyrophosphatase
VGVLLVNLGESPVTLARGDRIAQLVVAPVAHLRWTETTALPPVAGEAAGRGVGGFGSTG